MLPISVYHQQKKSTKVTVYHYGQKDANASLKAAAVFSVYHQQQSVRVTIYHYGQKDADAGLKVAADFFSFYHQQKKINKSYNLPCGKRATYAGFKVAADFFTHTKFSVTIYHAAKGMQMLVAAICGNTKGD